MISIDVRLGSRAKESSSHVMMSQYVCSLQPNRSRALEAVCGCCITTCAQCLSRTLGALLSLASHKCVLCSLNLDGRAPHKREIAGHWTGEPPCHRSYEQHGHHLAVNHIFAAGSWPVEEVSSAPF